MKKIMLVIASVSIGYVIGGYDSDKFTIYVGMACLATYFLGICTFISTKAFCVSAKNGKDCNQIDCIFHPDNPGGKEAKHSNIG